MTEISLQPVPQRRRHNLGQRIVACLFAGLVGLSTSTAHAGCLHTNQLWSCMDANGQPLELFCFGSGVLLTCMEFSGAWILVGRHEVLSQVAGMDSQVSSALAAATAHRAAATASSQTPKFSISKGQITLNKP